MGKSKWWAVFSQRCAHFKSVYWLSSMFLTVQEQLCHIPRSQSLAQTFEKLSKNQTTSATTKIVNKIEKSEWKHSRRRRNWN